MVRFVCYFNQQENRNNQSITIINKPKNIKEIESLFNIYDTSTNNKIGFIDLHATSKNNNINNKKNRITSGETIFYISEYSFPILFCSEGSPNNKNYVYIKKYESLTYNSLKKVIITFELQANLFNMIVDIDD